MVLLPVPALVNEAASCSIARYSLPMAAPLVVMHCGLSTLFVIVQPGGALEGSLRLRVLYFQSRKSPANSAVVGNVAFTGAAAERTYFHCSPTKKNNLSRLIGPPRFQAGLLKRSFGWIAAPVT